MVCWLRFWLDDYDARSSLLLPHTSGASLLFWNEPFLDTSMHPYKRLCPSVGPSIRPSVTKCYFRWKWENIIKKGLSHVIYIYSAFFCLSVCLSICLSVSQLVLSLVLPLVLPVCQTWFLDASMHLYKRLCPSFRRSVGPSIGPSIGPSVRPSVRRSVTKCYFRWKWGNMI